MVGDRDAELLLQQAAEAGWAVEQAGEQPAEGVEFGGIVALHIVGEVGAGPDVGQQSEGFFQHVGPCHAMAGVFAVP